MGARALIGDQFLAPKFAIGRSSFVLMILPGSIWVIKLGFSNVLAVVGSDFEVLIWMIFTSGLFPWDTEMCFFNLKICEQVCPQKEQLNFNPSWNDSTCLFSELFKLKFWLHKEQLNFFPSWNDAACLLSEKFKLKVRLHEEQLKFFPSWTDATLFMKYNNLYFS